MCVEILKELEGISFLLNLGILWRVMTSLTVWWIPRSPISTTLFTRCWMGPVPCLTLQPMTPSSWYEESTWSAIKSACFTFQWFLLINHQSLMLFKTRTPYCIGSFILMVKRKTIMHVWPVCVGAAHLHRCHLHRVDEALCPLWLQPPCGNGPYWS